MFVSVNSLRFLTFISAPLLLAIGLSSCTPSEKPADQPIATDTIAPTLPRDTLSLPKNPTESFKGSYNEKEVLFTHLDYTSYTLSMGGVLTKGNLNTEKGYGDDRNATVYVLNPDKPKNEQMYFVRTPSGSVYMLDQDRFVYDDAVFEPVKAPGLKPPAAETKKAEPKSDSKPEPKPVVEKKTESKPAAEKKAEKKSSVKKAKNKTKAKTSAQSKDSKEKAAPAKKTPAKKATKTSKKKKKKKAAAKKKRVKKKSTASTEKQDPPKSDK